MIGLALRLTALMTATLLLVVLTLVGAFYLQRQADVNDSVLPLLPARIGAIVSLLEASPAKDDEAILRAVNTADFEVRLREGSLSHIPVAQGPAQFPLLTRLIQRALPDGSRLVGIRAGDGPPGSSAVAALLGDGIHRPGSMKAAIELRDGRTVEFTIRGAMLRRTIRRPFIAAVLLLLSAIGIAALWGLRAQIRPLEALAGEVERIGTADDGAPLQERGAREVRQLVKAFNRMRERIDHLVHGRTRMLAAISHDLGTYLTRLRLRIEWIGDDEQRGRAERDLHDMHQLLRDTLALARIERGAETPRNGVDLVALAEREIREQRDSGAAVTLSATGPIVIPGHGLSLARVFANLIGNAIRHAGSAEVTIRRDRTFAEVIIDDRGPGIPAHEREAALEPFYRRDAARTLDDGGSGLGLAIVADIVRRHDGELQLEDRPGGGLRVRVRLPG
jgi:signal transduction histidine kinase